MVHQWNKFGALTWRKSPKIRAYLVDICRQCRAFILLFGTNSKLFDFHWHQHFNGKSGDFREWSVGEIEPVRASTPSPNNTASFESQQCLKIILSWHENVEVKYTIDSGFSHIEDENGPLAKANTSKRFPVSIRWRLFQFAPFSYWVP